MFCEEPSIEIGFTVLMLLGFAVLACIGAFKAIRYSVTGELFRDISGVDFTAKYDAETHSPARPDDATVAKIKEASR